MPGLAKALIGIEQRSVVIRRIGKDAVERPLGGIIPQREMKGLQRVRPGAGCEIQGRLSGGFSIDIDSRYSEGGTQVTESLRGKKRYNPRSRTDIQKSPVARVQSHRSAEQHGIVFMAEIDEVAGVASFAALARESGTTLFI